MNKRPNEKNERIKRRYLEYRKHVRQLPERTLDRELATLREFVLWLSQQDGFRRRINCETRRPLRFCA